MPSEVKAESANSPRKMPGYLSSVGNRRNPCKGSKIGDPAAVKVLIKALEDEIFDVRWLAAEGIIAIGLPALEPLLQETSKRRDSLWLREGVHRILHGIFSEDIAAIVKPVLKALEEIEASLKVPLAAENALKHFK